MKSLSESYSGWCIIRPVRYRFWGTPRQLPRSPVIRHLFYSSKLFNIVKHLLLSNIISTCPMYMPMLTILSYIWPLNLVIMPMKLQLCHLHCIRSCIHDVQNWMLMDRLKLYPDKTEFLIVGTRQQLEKVITSHLVVGKSRISPSTKVKNLGSWFDPNLDMISHIKSICSSSCYYLYNIHRIRKCLSHQSAISLIHAFITSKLEYCNSLLMAFLLFTLINFKEFKMLLRDL